MVLQRMMYLENLLKEKRRIIWGLLFKHQKKNNNNNKKQLYGVKYKLKSNFTIDHHFVYILQFNILN